MSAAYDLPSFTNKASCQDYPPDWWFPEEVNTSRVNGAVLSHTPEAMKARDICSTCLAFDECRNYSIVYDGLYGIWAGQDWSERQELQKKLRIRTVPLLSTYRNLRRTGDVGGVIC